MDFVSTGITVVSLLYKAYSFAKTRSEASKKGLLQISERLERLLGLYPVMKKMFNGSPDPSLQIACNHLVVHLQRLINLCGNLAKISELRGWKRFLKAENAKNVGDLLTGLDRTIDDVTLVVTMNTNVELKEMIDSEEERSPSGAHDNNNPPPVTTTVANDFDDVESMTRQEPIPKNIQNPNAGFSEMKHEFPLLKLDFTNFIYGLIVKKKDFKGDARQAIERLIKFFRDINDRVQAAKDAPGKTAKFTAKLKVMSAEGAVLGYVTMQNGFIKVDPRKEAAITLRFDKLDNGSWTVRDHNNNYLQTGEHTGHMSHEYNTKVDFHTHLCERLGYYVFEGDPVTEAVVMKRVYGYYSRKYLQPLCLHNGQLQLRSKWYPSELVFVRAVIDVNDASNEGVREDVTKLKFGDIVSTGMAVISTLGPDVSSTATSVMELWSTYSSN